MSSNSSSNNNNNNKPVCIYGPIAPPVPNARSSEWGRNRAVNTHRLIVVVVVAAAVARHS